MHRRGWMRPLATIGASIALAGIVYVAHPDWFTNPSTYQMPIADSATPVNPTPIPTIVKPTPTPDTPLVGVTQHLDGIWVTPRTLEHSQGASGVLPNLGDEFLIVDLRIRNRSQSDFPVHTGHFMVIDAQGQVDPPLDDNFTRRRLREVRLIPHGYTEGTLIFEVPQRGPAPTLIFQPDGLDPSKRKEWVLR